MKSSKNDQTFLVKSSLKRRKDDHGKKHSNNFIALHLLLDWYQFHHMKHFYAKSTSEQLSDYLRELIQNGTLGGAMPGVGKLVRQLGVGTQTVMEALLVLKQEGWLEGRGERRRSTIQKAGAEEKVALRIRILLYERSDAHDPYTLELQRRLEARGHQVEFAKKTLSELRFDVNRVARMVGQTEGDAWVIRAGPRAVLEWFAERPIPSFAMFGRQSNLPMASLATVKSPALAVALQKLVSLGHRRIVMLVREDRRKPNPGLFERRYLEQLALLGIETGSYNLPDWEDNAEGFHRCMDSLFQRTPPTALLASEPALFFATQQYLLGRGLVVPRDVSLISLDDHPAFAWFKPEVSRIHTDTNRWVSTVVRWVDHVAKGKNDKRETLIHAQFIEGGTIHPVS